MTPVDLTGKRFGRLCVIERVAPIPGQKKRWLCKCDCGGEHSVSTTHLTKGWVKSCGCVRRETTAAKNTTHGLSKLPEFKVWLSMVRRCTEAKRPDYARYGGRGIRVCEKWLFDFAAFFADMGSRPSPKHSIERRDNDGNYEPSNCYWATPSQQALNRHPKGTFSQRAGA